MIRTRQQFDQDLATLGSRVQEMGLTTVEMIRDAVAALVTNDRAAAAMMVVRDDVVDSADTEIEAQCLNLLALQQPFASDLRYIETILKIITDIERIADHAVDVANIVRKQSADSAYQPIVDIPALGNLAQGMLRDSLAAFQNRDLGRVDQVMRDRATGTALYQEITDSLQEIMTGAKEPSRAVLASHLLFVAHYLDRMGSHCVNIVERVAFVETGQRWGHKPHALPETEAAVNSPSVSA